MRLWCYISEFWEHIKMTTYGQTTDPAEVNNSFCIIIPQTAIIIYFLTYAQVRSAN